MPRIAVLGPGGVGGFIAGALERAGQPVTIIARSSTAAGLNRDGLSVRSVRLGDFHCRPRARERLDEPVDFLVVATKALGLEAAIERVQAAPGVVVPLLNGLDHIARLRRHFGERAVAAASIRIEADRPQPGHIVHSSPFLRVDLARGALSRDAELEQLAAALRAAEVPVEIDDSEAQVLWSKLVRLNALATTTSAFDALLGPIREDPARREQLLAAVREGAAVAHAEGASVEPDTVMAELDATHASLGSSMARDIAAGREPELDAIAGAVLRAAGRHGLRCPTIESLSETVARRAGLAPPAVARAQAESA